MDIRIEGLNGQLPNLDLVALAYKYCKNERIIPTLKNHITHKASKVSHYRHWRNSLITMLEVILSQSTGHATGNHGSFMKFGISSVTLNGYLVNGRKYGGGMVSVGRVIEGICRSLNNLLERLHQSYFFYLLPSLDRFLSIAYYIHILNALVAEFIVEAIVIWYSIVEKPVTEVQTSINELKPLNAPQNANLINDIFKIFFIFATSHMSGALLMYSAPFFAYLGPLVGFDINNSIFYGFFISSIILTKIHIKPNQLNYGRSVTILQMLVLIEYSIMLLGIGLINFPLAIFLGFIYVPLTLLISVTENRARIFLNYVLVFFAHPIMLLTLACLLFYTRDVLPYLPFSDLFSMNLEFVTTFFVEAIVNSELYGNWVFDIICCIFYPLWIIMAVVITSLPFKETVTKTKEKIE